MSRLMNTDYPLTDDQISEYRRNGFIRLNDVVVGEELNAMRDAVASAVAEETRNDTRPFDTKGMYEQIFIQKVNLWERHESVRRFTLSARFANIAARLEGRPMRVWHDQALFKEPHKGAKTPWHQDAPYWPHDDRTHSTTIWLALKDATTENGCMTFIPETHKIEFKPVDLGTPDDLFEFAPQFKGVRGEVRELKAGSATFHNGLSFHYAGPNKSAAMREAYAVLYMPDGTTYIDEPHVLTNGADLKVGQKLDGARHPLVSTVGG